MLDEHHKAQETSKKRYHLTEEKLILIKKLQLMTVQRLFFPEEVSFTIFGFIDNTMHAITGKVGDT